MRQISTQRRKQRKALYTLPWHQKRKKMGVHLDSKLIERYHVRTIPVRKGDTVKVVRGDTSMVGHEAKIAVIDISSMKVVVEGLTVAKADGKQKQKWVDPSNIIITKLDLSDPLRRKRIERRGRLAEGELEKEAEAEKKAAEEEAGKKGEEEADKKAGKGEEKEAGKEGEEESGDEKEARQEKESGDGRADDDEAVNEEAGEGETGDDETDDDETDDNETGKDVTDDDITDDDITDDDDADDDGSGRKGGNK